MQLCVVWGSQITRRSILFQCNNLSLVMAIKQRFMQRKTGLLRILMFFVSYFDMHIISICIAGILNVSTNNLPQFDTSSFFSFNSQATRHSTALPQPLLQLLLTTVPDWTSSLFRKLFTDTLAMV